MTKDISITPTGQEPQIAFTSSGNVSDSFTAINLNVVSGIRPSGAVSGVTSILFEGSQGTLLSIDDNLSSGTIFSVCDITGLPLIEATASGDVKLAEYGRYVGIGTGVPTYGFDVSPSGRFQKSITLTPHSPATTTDSLYYADGILTFNASGVGYYDTIISSGNLNDAAISALTTELRTESASGAIHAADILANSASGVASGNLNDAAINALTVELRAESASGVINAADILANAASGVVISGIAGAGGGGGSMTTVKSNGSAVGGTDIVTLDFSSDFGVAETPDTEINITIGTLNQNTTGSAATLTTTRAINGVNFDGSAAITVTAAGSTLSDTVTVAKGGTNATSFADKAVIITQDSGDDTLAAVAIDANGELLIGGTSGPAVATLTQGSNMTITNADGGITLASAGAGISDQILKDNVITLSTNGLDVIDQLNPVEFDWNQLAFDSHNGKTGHDFGLIAQEVEQILPEVVSLWRDHKTVDYAKLTVVLIKAVQELRQEVEDLKNA